MQVVKLLCNWNLYILFIYLYKRITNSMGTKCLKTLSVAS